jgi:hypothetical protein
MAQDTCGHQALLTSHETAGGGSRHAHPEDTLWPFLVSRLRRQSVCPVVLSTGANLAPQDTVGKVWSYFGWLYPGICAVGTEWGEAWDAAE